MKYRVSELEGALLDAAVAQIDPACEGITLARCDDGNFVGRDEEGEVCLVFTTGRVVKDIGLQARNRFAILYKPSSDWVTGGPIIERELMRSSHFVGQLSPEQPWHYWMPDNVTGHGPTPLIAAMRAFVAARLGPEVELPEAPE